MTKKKKDIVQEPPVAYQAGPPSFEKVWLMFQETDRKFQETSKKLQETDRLLEERFTETDRKIKKLSEITSGLGVNLGDVAEDYFRGALENMNELYGIPYKHVGSLQKSTGKVQGQYDIVLYNGNTMIVIEVKQKLHPSDVDDFHTRKLPNFRKLFPEYKDKKVLGGLAGLTVPRDAAERAIDLGYLVLSQSGQKIKVLNKKGNVLKVLS